MAHKPNLAHRHVGRDPQNMDKEVQMCCQHLELDVSETSILTSIGNSDSLAKQGPVWSTWTQPPLDRHQLSHRQVLTQELGSLSFFAECCDSWPQGDSFGKSDHAVCAPLCSPLCCKAKVLVAQSCPTLQPLGL